ncbi:MAG: VOC family protein [Deltaproteobacteria bacterium]|nr:VOC family protein [Deltaproteobacteria bacterium]
MGMRGLGYIGLASSDLAPWRAFATDFLGLMPAPAPTPAAAEDGSLFFRMDDRSWRLAVHPAERGGLAYAGWELSDRPALDAAVERARAAGAEIETPSEAERAARGVTELVRIRDPWGFVHELFTGAAYALEVPFVSPAGVSGFLTQGVGMGHMLLTVPDLRQAEAFYVEALGLRVTDRMDMGGGKGAAFLRASPRHHSLAVSDVLPDPNLHHFMIEAKRLDDVGRAWDRVQDLGIPIKMSLGQHANDPAVTFYAETPAGFDVEFGWKGLIVDEASWCVREFGGSGEIWGHRGVAMEAITDARADASERG